ncbi:hypothetical protein L0664_13895 [Octadecabacter sp. G9-8]|uniref:Uncharacterized protein n=1 Tax=Octadecabacter dasysiphoniae TaxID=2909341 RepID=A0ABS9CYB1_9RHOB|nr:hypothetical protein [Octadecabacter dasysiphoniae]MCF2872164.1 hypothetical protein [Octadecabacter dasysiphoniae]
MLGILLFIIAAVLAFLTVQGWKHDKRWARVIVIISLIVIVGVVGLVSAYIYALGQADWSY